MGECVPPGPFGTRTFFLFLLQETSSTAGLSPMDSWAVTCEETKLVSCWEGGEWRGQPPSSCWNWEQGGRGAPS